MNSPVTCRVTHASMADGRDLYYFDDSEPYLSARATRRLDDPRPLPDRFAPTKGPDGSDVPVTGPEMRRDPLSGEWIPMASHRMNRTFLPPAGSCPLCPARPGSAYSDGEIPDTDYDVAVFENRFPSYLAVPGVNPGAEWLTDGEALWPTRPAAGRCEVVCFSSDHSGSLASLPISRLRTVIEAWAHRTEHLAEREDVAYVYCFENRGEEIGVTLAHPHGQIYGYPVVPPKAQTLLRLSAEHRERTGGLLLRDVLDAERRAGVRIVASSKHWTAYVPAAARWPVEVHLAPNRDVIELPELEDAERDDLAAVYHELLGRLERFFVADDGAPVPMPYISGWFQAPTRGPERDLSRLHLQLFSLRRGPGKLKYLAGSESGMGAWISDTTPERIAARLQELAR